MTLAARFPIGVSSPESVASGAEGIAHLITPDTLRGLVTRIMIPAGFLLLDLLIDGESILPVRYPQAGPLSHFTLEDVRFELPPNSIVELKIYNQGRAAEFFYGGLLIEPQPHTSDILTKPGKRRSVVTPNSAPPAAESSTVAEDEPS